jgi:peptidylprolyl isomerase
MKRSLAAILAFSLVLLTGCGDKEVSATADNLPTVTTNMGEAPTIGAPSGTPPTTLESKDIVVGTKERKYPRLLQLHFITR